jgi:hypothetical protein
MNRSRPAVASVACAVVAAMWAGAAKGDYVIGDFESGLDPTLEVLQTNGGPNSFNGSVTDGTTHGTAAGSFTTAPSWQQYLRYSSGDKSDAGLFGQLQYYNDVAFDLTVPAGTQPNGFFLNEIVFNGTEFPFLQSGNALPVGSANPDVKGATKVTIDWAYRQKIANFDARYQQQVADATPYFQLILVANTGGGWDGPSFTMDNLRLTRLLGDANLNGRIDPDDYAATDRGRLKGLTGWENGDFNYDGAVTSDDYLLIDKNFVHAGGVFSPDVLASREAAFGADYVAAIGSAVPEPCAAAGLTIAAGVWGATSRRRRVAQAGIALR